MTVVTSPVVTKVLVKETAIHHASGELRWLDGASSADLSPVGMRPVDRPLGIDLTQRPTDLRWLHKPGRTAFWRRPVADIVTGEASETQRARPNLPLFRVAGTVADPTGAWHPRPFDLQLGDGASIGVVVYASPQATRFGGGGGLFGMVRFDGGEDATLSGRPAAWALVDCTVTVSAQDIRAFRAQCDGKGDFRLSLWRLPPLPQGSASYPAEIAIRALASTTAEAPVDPDTLAGTLVAPLSAGAFAASIALAVVPGEIRRVESAGGRSLAIRPVVAPPVPNP
jgi:hypothetical protein